jgi:hypothetical protein
MKGIALAAVVSAGIVLGSIFTFLAISNVYHGAGTMLGTGIMTDECQEYQERHWGMGHGMHDGCHGHDRDHEHEDGEIHEDCHEYDEDHPDHHDMFEECSEHHEEHQDGHHMMHNH